MVGWLDGWMVGWLDGGSDHRSEEGKFEGGCDTEPLGDWAHSHLQIRDTSP
jgi:hypothetical protein